MIFSWVVSSQRLKYWHGCKVKFEEVSITGSKDVIRVGLLDVNVLQHVDGQTCYNRSAYMDATVIAAKT